MPKRTNSHVLSLPPRRQAPILLGLSLEENALITKAAKRMQLPRMTFVRDAVLFQAREVLGLKQPAGE